jgi:hypothetical protein
VPNCPLDLGKRRALKEPSANDEGPPLKKQSPAAVGSNRRANDQSSHRSHSRNQESRQQPHREFAVYDGQNWLGTVCEFDDRFTATDAEGRALGTFANLTAAADAVSSAASRGGAQ